MSIYEELGIDPHKSSVKKIFGAIIDNEFPNAFVNIVKNPFGEGYLTQHQDGDGSKSVLRFLHFLEKNDESIFKGMVDDAFSMNTGDVAASGFVFGPWVISDVLNIGKLPEGGKEIIMKAIAIRFAELKELYQSYGFNISFLGGETAELPDQVRSSVFDMTITASCTEHSLIKGDVEVGDKIYGFSSYGQAAWENTLNSGIMSNGITLARTLLSKVYNDHYVGLKRIGDFYTGNISIMDPQYLSDGMSIVDAILSPTRQWAIVIRKIIEGFAACKSSDKLHGIVMNTGGGATKILNIGENIKYQKTMPTPPPIFFEIQKRTGEEWVDMYTGMNCGVGIDIITEGDKESREILKKIAKECKIKLFEMGKCYKGNGKNEVELSTDFGEFCY